MSIDPKAINELEAVLDAKVDKANKLKTSRVAAEVLNVDQDGTVWVHVLGGAEKTPCTQTNASVKAGDQVTVIIENGRASIEGNISDPSAGVERVDNLDKALSETQIVAQQAANGVSTAVEASEAAKTAAKEAAAAIGSTNAHFWHNEQGAHVTDEEKDDFLAAEAEGFPDWQPDVAEENYKPWYNVLLNQLGQVFRTGSKYLASFTHSAISFFDGEGNEAENIVARFGTDGAQIGKSSDTHVNISDGLFSASVEKSKLVEYGLIEGGIAISDEVYLTTEMISGNNVIVSLTHKPVIAITSIDQALELLTRGGAYSITADQYKLDKASGILTLTDLGSFVSDLLAVGWAALIIKYTYGASAPYMTIGTRADSPGVFTAAIGSYIDAISPNSLVGGTNSTAHSGSNSFAWGNGAVAYGDGAVALGRWVTATGDGAVAIGQFTPATSSYSPGESDGYLLKIGNGKSAETASNALTVDWDGDVGIAGALRPVGATRGGVNWVSGARGEGALVYSPHVYNADAYNPAIVIQTKDGGSWAIGSYNDNSMTLARFTKATIDANSNVYEKLWRLYPDRLHIETSTSQTGIRIRHTNVNISNASHAAPSAHRYSIFGAAYDSTSTEIGKVHNYIHTDGRSMTELVASRYGATTSARVSNYFTVWVKPDGSTGYSIQNPTAFRTSLGASNGVWTAAQVPTLQNHNGTLTVAKGGTGATSGAGALGNLGVKRGSTSITTDSSYRIEKTITFSGTAFTAAPQVFLQIVYSPADSQDNANKMGGLTAVPQSISATSFAIHLHNRYIASGTAITIHWLAIGNV